MADLIYYRKEVLGAFIRQAVFWRVPLSRDFPQGVKYRFVLIHKGKRILGYDNKAGEGHHKHFEGGKSFVCIDSIEGVFRLHDVFLLESETIMKSKGVEID